MYKYILERAGEINWLGTAPLLLFVIFFMAISIRAIKRDKKYIKKMSALPLEEE